MLVSAEEAERRRIRMRYLRKAAELEEFLSRLNHVIQDFHHAHQTFTSGRSKYSAHWQGDVRHAFDRVATDVNQSRSRVEQTYSELRQETRNKIHYYRQKAANLL
ncbi:hypothetical protein [Aquibacillus kalidii]|uniref:hypothetical protein n=1 Tax=Aquibacillus kalidii TaxID=2762597 RepID=UPI0016472179|nr:hypothetical protein [Aquibacillus kalidii]